MRSASRLERRTFLKGVALPVIAAAACTRRRYDPSRFPLPARSVVALLPASRYDVDFADLVFRGLRELQVDVSGRRVLLKPNLVEHEPGAPINTDPRLVIGAAAAMRRAGARSVVVGEGPGHQRDIEYLVSATGLADLLRGERVPFVDLNADDFRWRQAGAGFTGLERFALPVEVLQADLVVSMPRVKTHHWAGMTCSMKNLFGVIPGAVYGWPKNVLHQRGIEASILDITATVRPQLAIVDGVIGMEGDGPIMGRARPLGYVAMSTDLVAADATCARTIGLDPARIGYLANASAFLGNLDAERIDHRGEDPRRFATAFDLVEDFKGLRLASGG